MQFLGGLGAARLPGYPTISANTLWAKRTQEKDAMEGDSASKPSSRLAPAPSNAISKPLERPSSLTGQRRRQPSLDISIPSSEGGRDITAMYVPNGATP